MPSRLTPEQYLELDRNSKFRNEYYDGQMYRSGSGGPERKVGEVPHAIAVSNLIFAIRRAAGSGFIVLSNAALSHSKLYPDIMVVGAAAEYGDADKDTIINPILVAEALSPSTAGRDLGFKAAKYRAMPSIQHYLLVSLTHPHVETYRRLPSGGWLMSESSGLDGRCILDTLNCAINLKDIYENISFE